MSENTQKKTAPVSSATTDVEQSLEKSSVSIIPKENELCNMSTSKNGEKMSNEHILQRIETLVHDNFDFFPKNDIGTSRLFYSCFENKVVYVHETKCWYIYQKKYWIKDDGNLLIMEIGKQFVLAYTKFALTLENEELVKFTARLCSRSRRESIIKDACSIAPKSLSVFDDNPSLFNCKNGTYNLKTRILQPYDPQDYITKISNVIYDENATCDRWSKFISEIMQENKDSEYFLQKALGYSLSGETNLECFFIFYGSTTTVYNLSMLRLNFH